MVGKRGQALSGSSIPPTRELQPSHWSRHHLRCAQPRVTIFLEWQVKLSHRIALITLVALIVVVGVVRRALAPSPKERGDVASATAVAAANVMTSRLRWTI